MQPLIGQELYRLCIFNILYGQRVDRACTFQFIGQTFDRLLTEFGQRLDFTSNLCPTNQWVLVPNKGLH